MTPETFTDDIAPAFPSSLLGPLQVRSAVDADDWIKIDPASAAIEAAGGARLVRRLVAPFTRTHSSSTSGTIGTVLSSRIITSVTEGGFFVAPFPIPHDMDFTEPASVYVLAAPLTSSSQTTPVVRFTLAYTYGKPGSTPSDGTITLDWTAPDNWAADEPRSVLMDDGNGRTFAPDTFEAGDELGLRIARVGTATEDTFDKSLKIAERLVFEYTAKQF